MPAREPDERYHRAVEALGRVLVTGGCGFVGTAVAAAFADAGRLVRVVDPGCRPFREDIEFLDVDITRPDAVLDACEGVATVVHCASLVQTRNNARDAIWAVNHGGTVNLLTACRLQGVERFVHISSASVVYEGRDIEAGDEDLPYGAVPLSAYADSKIAAERDVLAVARAGRVRACALRPHLVFGPGDNRLVPNILARARRGRIREVGGRRWLSDYVYIDNLVDAVLAAEAGLARDASVSGEAFFITNGEPVAFFEFVDRLLTAMGEGPVSGRVPVWIAYGAAALVEAYHAATSRRVVPEDGFSRFAVRYLATHHYFSIDKARRELGWRPRVSLGEGIERTAAWFGGLGEAGR